MGDDMSRTFSGYPWITDKKWPVCVYERRQAYYILSARQLLFLGEYRLDIFPVKPGNVAN